MTRKKLTVSISKSSPSIVTFASEVGSIGSRAKKITTADVAKFTELYGSKRSIVEVTGRRGRLVSDTPSSTRVKRDDIAGIREYPYVIIEEGKNYNPKPLNDPLFPNIVDSLLLPRSVGLTGRMGARPTETGSTLTSVQSVSRYSIGNRSRGMSFTQSIMEFNEEFLTGRFSLSSLQKREEFDEEVEYPMHRTSSSPSIFRLREDPPPLKEKVKQKFTLNLQETETMFLLDLPTGANFLESEEGKAISEMNAQYEKQLETNKSLSYAATQTAMVFQKNLKFDIPRAVRANARAWATSWDIYDTYLPEDTQSTESEVIRTEGKVDDLKATVLDDTKSDYQLEYDKCKFNEKILNSLMVMERLVEQKTYRKEQLLSQGLLVEDPLSVHVKCTYTLHHLWTFNTSVVARCRVTSMCWSLENLNILAVGYGKFKYEDKCNGAVCVWNVKNPRTPERYFRFDEPVTFVSFSPKRHQILAVSCYSGRVTLVDITSRSLLVKASNSLFPLYHPIWQVRWLPSEGPAQYFMTCGQNGIIYKYKKTKFVHSRKMMSLGRPHGTIQGVEQPRKCFARKVLARCHPAALVLILHPEDPTLYLVGSSEGCVYVCSVNHRHEHIEVFVAHNGPVYNIQYNPFCSKVLLTCGADYCIRIWAESIFEPLATLQSGMDVVQDAVWDPLRSTVIFSITGSSINIWDIRRNTSKPKSSTESPGESYNTVLQFSGNKYNVCVGDVRGNVHVMAPTEMPFSPSFQEEVLVHAINSHLITRPDLRSELRKMGHPFDFHKKNFHVRSVA